MKKINTILLIICSLTAFSQQSIVNVERSSPRTDSSSVINVDGLGNFIGGNNDLYLISSSVGYGQNFGSNSVKLIGGGSYITSYNSVLNNSWFGQLRHNYELSDYVKTFVFYQYQYNNVLLLDRRQLGGAGVRFKVMPDSSKVTFDILTGLMFEEELLNTASLMPNEMYHTKFIRGATSLVFKTKITKGLSVTNTTYYQPHISDPSDFRVLNDLDILLAISKTLNFIISSEYRYDSKPPSSLRAYDYNVTFGVNYKFEK